VCATQVLPGNIGVTGYSTMVADGTNLYWSLVAKNLTAIYKLPLSGGTPTLLWEVGTAYEVSPPFAVGATSVYFWGTATSSTAISLMQVPIAGARPPPSSPWAWTPRARSAGSSRAVAGCT
jgi:hypothetical protein